MDEALEAAAAKAAHARIERLLRKQKLAGAGANLLITLFVGVALLAVFKLMSEPVASDLGWAALAVAPLVFGLIVMGRLRQRAAWRLFIDGAGPHPYEQVLRVGATHLFLSNPRGDSTIPLARIAEVESRRDDIVVHLRAGATLLVPNRAFADEAARERFVAALRPA